jgi:putative GTP pyrophosphokinase
MTMPSQKAFLTRFKITDEQFASSGIDWKALEVIHDDFVKRIPQLEGVAELVSNQLMKLRKVHSIRWRVKEPEHLIEKIIRKKIEKPDRIITLENYLDEITDLVGVRAIHLFKDYWTSIHKYITETWDLKEQPIAYIRNGDPETHLVKFQEKGCLVKPHPVGYRSLHFIIGSKPAKQNYFVEIQVRTIFEEGWSEIDHEIRYPYEKDNTLYTEFLSILNRLAGSADEMGSFVKRLELEFIIRQEEYEQKLDEKDVQIKTLEAQVLKLDIKPEEKAEIQTSIERLAKIPEYPLNKFLEIENIMSRTDKVLNTLTRLADEKRKTNHRLPPDKN